MARWYCLVVGSVHLSCAQDCQSSLMHGVQCYGDVRSHASVETAIECSDLCCQTAGCSAFSFGEGVCHMKTACPHMRQQNDYQSGILQESAPPVLLSTSWSQYFAFAQYAPRAKTAEDYEHYGSHERLGCDSTAWAQILFMHRLCPLGSVSYQAPGFESTGMDFDLEALNGTLCDWSKFVDRPPEDESDPSMQAVAKYEYAVSLVLEKKWGTHSYMLSYSGRDSAISKTFGVIVTRLSLKDVTRDEMVSTMKSELAAGRPMKLMLSGQNGANHHHLVVDGWQTINGVFMVHLNMGHHQHDNGWYNFDAPICAKHQPNGTTNANGTCAFYYNDVNNKTLWTILPRTRSMF